MTNKEKKLQARQDYLRERICISLSKQEKKDLKEIIDIEYKLTMVQEGHPSELNQ